MTTTNSRLTELEQDMVELQVNVSRNADKVERKFTGRSDFMVCAARQIDRIQDKLGIDPACQLEIPE